MRERQRDKDTNKQISAVCVYPVCGVLVAEHYNAYQHILERATIYGRGSELCIAVQQQVNGDTFSLVDSHKSRVYVIHVAATSNS